MTDFAPRCQVFGAAKPIRTPLLAYEKSQLHITMKTH